MTGGVSEPLTAETLDYALVAFEYGAQVAYEKYLEILAEAILNGHSEAEEE